MKTYVVGIKSFSVPLFGLTTVFFIQIQYAKTGLEDAKDMAEEKYELVHRKVVDTWGQITEEREEGSEDIVPDVSTAVNDPQELVKEEYYVSTTPYPL